MEQYEVNYVVVGAGVIGLAIARQLALLGKEVLLLEKSSRSGEGISSRNSEVIHAGIYYPKGSLKAELCVQGKAMLYDYCRQYHIPFRQQGKLIVACNQAEQLKLANIQQHAVHNGVIDIQRLSRNELSRLEPELASVEALYSPSTGTLDSHAYMLQLQADFENAGGLCVFNSDIVALKTDSEGIHLHSTPDNTSIVTKYCINACGLDAVSFCRELAGFPVGKLPQAWFAKGSYFSYQGAVPFRHLIYPVPVNGGLGVHLTLDLQGRAKFGPDVEWLSKAARFDFQVDDSKRRDFADAVRSYWPHLDEAKLCPDYAGIRPKISGPDEASADFLIQDERQHGIKGLVNLLGIESPGLTASLAIAERVAASLK